jgi:hypothetical protein
VKQQQVMVEPQPAVAVVPKLHLQRADVAAVAVEALVERREEPPAVVDLLQPKLHLQRAVVAAVAVEALVERGPAVLALEEPARQQSPP